MKRKGQKISSLLFLIILVVGVVICCKRWSVWFGNLPEPVYTLSSEPQRIILTFGNNGEYSRNVSWVCGTQLEKAMLEYTRVGSNDTLLLNASSHIISTAGGETCASWVGISDLHSNSSYSYRVWNNNLSSSWHKFSTANDSTNNFSFVFLGDIQDSINGTTSLLVDSINRKYPATDFYMLGGDFAERPMNCYWEEAYGSISSVATNKPIIACPGNHEYLKGVIRTIDPRFTYAFSYFLNSKVKNNHLYRLDYKDATILTLDSNRGIGFLISQRSWLEEQLQNSTKKWKIVMLHHPVYSIKGKNNNLFERWMFDDLFRKYGVDLVLQGHEHNYGRMTVKGDNGELTTPLYIVSHASPKHYTLMKSDDYDRYGTGSRYYQIIDLSSNHLDLKVYLDDHTLYDHVKVIKNDGHKVEVKDLAQGIEERASTKQ